MPASRCNFVGLLGLVLAAVVNAQDVAVPEPLLPWQEWVLYGQEQARCPVRDGSRSAGQCRWPGELKLDVDAGGLRFEQEWTLHARQRVPLPGDARLRAIDVEVDGRATPVAIDGSGRQWLLLDAGVSRVRGHVSWTRRPSTLSVPDEVALIALRVDGAVVARPERNEDGALLLSAVGADEGDELQLEVYRLLGDGVPQLLATRVLLSVSGRPREQTFASLLPDGFVPVALDSEVPARLEADGRLRLQLRSGAWTLTLIARAAQPQTSFMRGAAVPPWPAQEIWQFRAAPHFRVAQLTGLPGVDPNQTPVPDWQEGMDEAVYEPWHALLHDADSLPAYLFDTDAVAQLEIALRGLPAQRPARLSLRRELWLDFDGAGFSASDHITGRLGSASRLDLRAPWRMQRAQRDEKQGLLITSPGDEALSGIELRDADVDIEIDARVSRDGIVRASGWTQAFDQARAVLHLPPGYRLIAATGADHAGASWWQAWNLLDLFLLSVIGVLAWRLGGPLLLVLALVWGVLSWHEPYVPRVGVLLLLLSALLARHVGAGRVGKLLRLLRATTLVAVALLGLQFAATELRLALHPQLEQRSASGQVDEFGYQGSATVEATFLEPPPHARLPQAPVRQQAQGKVAQEDGRALESVVVTGTRIKSVDMFSYPADAIVQSGAARPNWQWHRHDLSWNGPLLPDDEFGLVLSPPAMTRLWRVAAVLLLFALLWRVLRAGGAAPRVPPRAAAVALLLPLLTLGSAVPLRAQAMPDAALLDALRERLIARNEPCRPRCGSLAAVTVVAQRERLLLSLDAHAQADTVWPLPRTDASLVLVALRIDGKAGAVLRDDDGDWLHLTRGVRRIEVEYVPEGERWRITFPLPPGALELRAAEFEAIGLDQGRLVGDTLELVPPRTASSSSGGAAADVAEAVPAFVRVRRSFWLDQRWEMSVSVQRVAPARSGINIAVPLLPGEQPFQNAPTIRDGRAMLSLPAGVDTVEWRSRLLPAPELSLTAGDGREMAEEWRLVVAPLLHVETRGLPESGQEGDVDGAVRRFLPLPGETLQVRVTRPEAVAGARVAIENVSLQVTPGQRARDASLAFELRATQAGQHVITLPPEAELLGLSIDGETQPLVLDAGKLRLPLRPTMQRVAVQWREPIGAGLRIESPAIALGASAANLRIDLTQPEDRWLLIARGPRVGPAVLIWGELLVMLLAAAALARFGRTPLRLRHWLLLGLGFSTLSWMAAALVAGWLMALAWRGRRPDLVERRVFPWLQIGLVGLSGAALLALVIAVPYGLLGEPDMHVAGNGSDRFGLHWFADRSEDGVMPVVQLISMPLWIYKLAMLGWAIWLANALIGWLRWGARCLVSGGGWRPIFRRKPSSSSSPATPPET